MMTRRQKELAGLVLTLLIGVFTNVATSSLPDEWKPYLWLSWAPLGVCVVVVLALQFVPERDATDKASNDQVNPQISQGHIGQTNDPVSQNVGQQTNINTEGGPALTGNQIENSPIITGGAIFGDVIGQQVVQQVPSLPLALHQLRAPVSDFVGREREIDQLVQALSRAASGGVVAVIRGMGGIGKSELAYVVASRVASAFPDAQLVVNLRGTSDSPLTPAQAVQAVIRRFAPEARLPEDPDDLLAYYRSLLRGRHAIILADDARDAAQVRLLMPPLGCALLVTSRNRFSLAGMVAIDLRELALGEAERLLLEICPRIAGYAAELSELCGYLPLALRVSGSLLMDYLSRDVGRYVEQLRAERLGHLKDLEDPDDPVSSVEASLRLSYDALEPPAQAALCQMSVFPASFDSLGMLFTISMEAQDVTVRERLARRSLLEWDAANERFYMHDLVREFGAARLEDSETWRYRHAAHYALRAERAGELCHGMGPGLQLGLALFDQERANIDAGWRWALARAGEGAADRLLCAYTRALTQIVVLRYDAYDTRRELIPYLEATVAAARRLSDRRQEGNVLGDLGGAYLRLGEAGQAIAALTQALAIHRELGNRRGEFADLGNLAGSHILLGEAHKAVDFYTQGLVVARTCNDQFGEAQMLSMLGSAYTRLREMSQAVDCYRQCLFLAHKIGSRFFKTQALWHLGEQLAEHGDLVPAVKLMRGYADYLQEIAHPDAKKHAAYLESLRQRLAHLHGPPPAEKTGEG